MNKINKNQIIATVENAIKTHPDSKLTVKLAVEMSFDVDTIEKFETDIRRLMGDKIINCNIEVRKNGVLPDGFLQDLKGTPEEIFPEKTEEPK